MGRHVIVRLRGPREGPERPRWTRARAQSFPRSYFRVLEGFVQLQVHTKAFVGTPVALIERLIRNFQQASPPLSDGGPPWGRRLFSTFALRIKP